MEIRKTLPADLPTVMEIYAYARSFMARTGNGTQWGEVWPPQSLIEEDITLGKSYVCTEGGKILAVFFYDYGEDIEPTYAVIHEGSWMSDTPYGVIHRIAVASEGTGAGRFCINWALQKTGHLRIDTHENNAVMRHILETLDYSYRGMIDIEQDYDPRMAFEKLRDFPAGNPS